MATLNADAKRIGVLPLVASTFFMVSGGAYGLEELVGCGYPIAIATLLLTPVLWSLPTALMVGELASALPKEGGYYAWVRRALGPFWGFQEAWLSLVASIFDMAIYPTLFTLYMGTVFPGLSSGPGALAGGTAIVVACAAWNLRGVATVGVGSIILGIAVLAPFAAFTLFAACKGPNPVGLAWTRPAMGSETEILGGTVIAMWNYMGWDNASTIATDVRHPAHTYPRAVFVTLGLVALTYLVPVCGAAWAGIDPSGWTTGDWVSAGQRVGGRGLAMALVAGGSLCGIGMFNALLLSYSRLPVVLAEDGYLPRWIARRSTPLGTPWASILVCSTLYAACLGLGFRRLVELDILLYGASLLLEFVALVVLRMREPELTRPFKVRGGIPGAAALGIAPAALLGIAAWRCRDETIGPIPSLAVGACLVALGPLVYAARSVRTGRASRVD